MLDLNRISQIGRAHRSARPKPENPAWQNAHHDIGFLLGQIDALLACRELPPAGDDDTPLSQARRVIVQLSARATELHRDNQRLGRDLAHVQANHADMVQRAALLRERPDLPIDRLPAYRELVRLQDELAATRQALHRACGEAPPVPLYYVAVYGGFVVMDEYRAGDILRQKIYTVPDARLATPFASFEAADSAGKHAVARLYPPDLRYFAILRPTFGQHGDQDPQDQ
jgi:hypothetical protein